MIKRVVVVGWAGAGDKPASAHEDPVGSNVPPLPQCPCLAGSLVHDGRWYALDSADVAGVNKLLAGKPRSMPEGVIHVSLPPTNNKIILWGDKDGRIAPTDVIDLDDNAYFLISEKKSHLYNDPDSEDRKRLAKLIQRIESGREHALAVNGAPTDFLKVESKAWTNWLDEEPNVKWSGRPLKEILSNEFGAADLAVDNPRRTGQPHPLQRSGPVAADRTVASRPGIQFHCKMGAEG